MEVTIREEAGYEMALYGLSLSFKDRKIPYDDWWSCNNDRQRKLVKTATALCKKDGGHNKFLEAITVWIDLEAPRFFWSEFDTYRVGMTKQSESTMHTVLKRYVEPEDFAKSSTGWGDTAIKVQCDLINNFLDISKDWDIKERTREIKKILPDGYLQRRLVVTNYKTLRNMILQRRNHRLPEWQIFCHEIYNQVAHSELLPKVD